MMEEKLFKFISEIIKKRDAGFLLGCPLGASLYLLLCFLYPVVFPPEPEIVLIAALLGGLLGLAFQKIIESIYNSLSASIKSIYNSLIASAKYIFNSLFNRKPNKLKEFQTDKIILNDKLNTVKQCVEIGLISPSKGKEIVEKLLKEYLFETTSNQERLPFNSENEEQYLLPNDTISDENEEQDQPPDDSL